jgi:putative ABC transport system permease protein
VAQGLLPRLGREGAMADFGYALAERGPTMTAVEEQVWLGAAAPADAVQRLTGAGLTVTHTESLADRIAVLNRDGTALALRLFLVSAATALVLAAGTLLASAYVVARRRSYELAALRVLGASRGVLVRAGRREQLALGSVGTLVGALAGAAAATVALPALDRLSGSGDGPPMSYAPAWGALSVLLVVTIGVLAVLAHLGARRAVHLAVPDRLREVQA